MSKRQQLEKEGVYPPSENLLFAYYKPLDSGYTTEYTHKLAYHEEMEHIKRPLPTVTRQKKGHGNSGALTAAGSLAQSGFSVTRDPEVLRMAQEIRESEGRQPRRSASVPSIKATADPELVEGIRRKHKKNNLCNVFADPKRDHEMQTAYVWYHADLGPRENPDKTHFNKKTFYTEYTEALALQAGLQCAKK
mmetsp:Transcript_109305/g.189680  ORF Transcript_109305/g.189680 Transcript_109305/m.189680 type:complete len:192 (-) Transcript_109305:79-654(-)